MWTPRLLALVVVVAAAACGTGPPDHVRLGLVAPLTGSRAFIGQEMLNGARIAVEELNREGGLLGQPVELVVEDDADLVDLPGQLADLAERQRVTAVVGPEAPGVLLGPRSPLTRRDVPALLPSALAGDVTDASSLVIRTIPAAVDQAETLGRWLSDVRAIDRLALLIADPVEGDAAREDLLDGFVRGGVEVEAVVEAAGDAADLGPSVAALRRAAPDVRAVMLWGPPAPAARATIAVRRQNWDVQVLVPPSAFVSEYRTLAGDASENVVLAFPYREEWFTEPVLMNWLLRYHREHGLGAIPELETLVLDVPVAAVAAYDAVMLVAEAVRVTGSRVPAEVANALVDVEVEGILRTYELGGAREAWDPRDLYVARFHQLATVYDVDPRLDLDEQLRLWQAQVNAEYIPPSVLEGPGGAIIEAIIAERIGEVKEYIPPAPPPGPITPGGVTR
ncbi:MAG: ABC transporter substrate-binding protein [Actinobacteria bacterium]|nr:ABC transporter substrate-binding protein [Actinomycetota bacterium]